MRSCFVLITFHQKVYDPGVVCFWFTGSANIDVHFKWEKKGTEDKTLRSEFSSIFLIFIFSNNKSCRASIEIDTGSGIGFWASSNSGVPVFQNR